MGLISTLLTLPVSGPIKAFLLVAGKVAEQANEEMLDENRIHQQLMELELRRDLGEIDEAEHRRQEEGLLERLDAIREYKEEQERDEG